MNDIKICSSLKFLAITILASLALGCSNAVVNDAAHRESLDYSEEQMIRDSLWASDPVMGNPDSASLSSTQAASAVVEQEKEPVYSFQAKNLPIEEACKLFGEMYGLNVVVEQKVTGTVSVDLRDLPFSDIMQSLLGANGYYWERRGNIVYVKSWETRTFTIDYIRLVRSGSGSSQAQVSSSSSGEGGGDTTAGSMSIHQEDKVDFWLELEEQLKVLTSEEGRLVTNRLAGTVQISDHHRHVQEVAAYIDQINEAIYRQVDIEVKIVEITLSEDNSLGVDWSKMELNGTGEFVEGTISNIIETPIGGITALAPSLDLTYSNINDLDDVTAIIQALNEQGDVQIVSQPHIRTLNNQSALIKVGTDRTFFRKEQSTDSTSAGSLTTSTDVPQVVTEGIVLSITPQISANGWITLDVSPVVTRVSSITEARDNAGNVSSTAPNLDISQVSSLVRARGGETIVIGGLIQNQQIETVRRVPGFGHLPILGKFFSANYTSDVKKELIMLMTPRLVTKH